MATTTNATETFSETASRVAAKFTASLNDAGFFPVWAGLNSVFVAEFATTEDAERCAAYFRQVGCQDVTLIAADEDCGPTVTMRVAAKA